MSCSSCRRPACSASPFFAKELERVAAGYGIEVRFNSEVVEVDPGRREALVKDSASDTKDTIGYDVMHLVPPQGAPDWLKATPLADPATPAGYVQVDKHTMQHTHSPRCSRSAPQTMQPAPSFPLIDTTKERKDMWLLKKYGLPALYWNLMLKGRA